MTGHVTRDSLLRFARLGSIVALCLVLISCDVGGGDDEEPTPTETTTTSQIEPPVQSTESAETPEADSGTPENTFVLLPPSPDASATEPAGADATADESTPVRTGPEATEADETTPESSPDQPEGTPVSDTSPDLAATLPPNAVTGSDGTSGPVGLSDLLDGEGTPAASPVATPDLGDVTEVDSCDVVDAPPFQGENATYTPFEEVNFRVGPGADCDPVLDGPLNSGVEITVLSEPVVRSDDADRVLWVQVEVDGEVGWVAAEFIEPAG
jgi:hypothetical protein